MSAAVLVFGVCVVCCVVGHVAILMSVLRRRATVVDTNVPRPRTSTEVIWALIPAIVLAFVLTATWVRVRDRAAPEPAEVMKVAR